MVKKIAKTAVKNPTNFKAVVFSLNQIIENKTGKTNESLLANVVIVIPAFWEDFPIRKNMIINKVPRTIPEVNQDFESLNSWKLKCVKMPNPNKVATK